MILLPAAVAVLGCVVFALTLPDPRATRREPFGWLDLLRTFWVNPRRRPDFD